MRIAPLLLGIALFAPASADADPIHVKVESKTVSPGDSYSLAVEVLDADSLGGLLLTFSYGPDKNVVPSAPLATGDPLDRRLRARPVAGYPDSSGDLGIAWLSADGVSADEILLTLPFHAKGAPGTVDTVFVSVLEAVTVSGEVVPTTVEPGIVTFAGPTPVALFSFEAVDTGEGARITWEASDRSVLGYHIHRRTGARPLERLTTDPVPAVGGVASRYEWIDDAPSRDEDVEYFLVEVTRSGGEGARFGPARLVRRSLARALHAIFPSPARGPIEIRFTSDARREALLEVFDLAGRRVVTLARGPVERGTQSVSWDGRDDRGREVAGGIYLVQLSLDGWTANRKVTLAR